MLCTFSNRTQVFTAYTKRSVDQMRPFWYTSAMKTYRAAVAAVRKAAQTGVYPPCPECNSTRTFARYERPNYYVYCKSCGYEGEPKLTAIGALREWIRLHDRLANCGGWTRLYKFQCCGEPAEVTCTGPDPRRRLDGQTVTVRCQTCNQSHTASRFQEIVWSSIPKGKFTSSGRSP